MIPEKQEHWPTALYRIALGLLRIKKQAPPQCATLHFATFWPVGSFPLSPAFGLLGISNMQREYLLAPLQSLETALLKLHTLLD